MEHKDLPFMFCGEVNCVCEYQCCQSCTSLDKCTEKCKSVQYKEKIATDRSFLIEQLTELAEKQDSWLMMATVDILKDALTRAATAKSEAAALREALEWVRDFASNESTKHDVGSDAWCAYDHIVTTIHPALSSTAGKALLAERDEMRDALLKIVLLIAEYFPEETLTMPRFEYARLIHDAATQALSKAKEDRAEFLPEPQKEARHD